MPSDDKGRLGPKRVSRAAIASAACAVVFGGCEGDVGLGRGEAATAGPNIVLVLADDQTADSIAKMPWLSAQSGWVRFEHAYANQPWCCPARVSILSGQHSHHHGVIGNARFARDWDSSSSLATSLDEAGYETGLFGKYLNGFPWAEGERYVPEGWDRWTSFLNTNGAYYDYALGIDGARVARRGSGRRDHSTEVLARRAVQFAQAAPEPFFAMVTPYSPHAPTTPAPGDEGAFAGEPVKRPPNFNRVADDAPSFFLERAGASWSDVRRNRRQAWEAALAVDRGLRQLYAAVDERGALGRTVFVYLSDNGYSFGSHRYGAKNCLYQECARIPLAIHMPSGAEESVSTPVSNVDLAPTLAALAGAQPLEDVDGESLAPALLGEVSWPGDRDLLLEVHSSKQGVPDGYAVVNSSWKYAEHETGERELYDLESDPYELDNLAGEPAHAEVQADLENRLKAMLE